MTPTQTKRQEKTVALTHMEVLKLISDGHFWRGPCDCSEETGNG